LASYFGVFRTFGAALSFKLVLEINLCDFCNDFRQSRKLLDCNSYRKLAPKVLENPNQNTKLKDLSQKIFHKFTNLATLASLSDQQQKSWIFYNLDYFNCFLLHEK